jgi:hypothetical protein
MTDLALPIKWGAFAINGFDASGLSILGDKLQLSKKDPNAIMPIPVLHCFKKCLLV